MSKKIEEAPEVTEQNLSGQTDTPRTIEDREIAATRALTEADRLYEEGDIEGSAKALADHNSLMADLDRAKRHSDALSAARRGAGKPINTVPLATGEREEYNEDDNAAQYRTSHKPAGWMTGPTGRSFPAAVQPKWVREQMGENEKAEADLYKEAFRLWMTSPNDAAFFRTADPVHVRAMEAGTDAEGGYLVPEDWMDTLLHDPGVPGSVHRGLCTVVQTARDAGNMPTIAAVTVATVAEEAAITGAESTPTVGQVTFAINKFMGMVRTSDELLADNAHNLPSVLTQLFNEAFGRHEDTQIIGGDGTTEHQGIRTQGATDSVMASATALAVNDLHDLYWDLPAQYRGNGTLSRTSSLGAQMTKLNSAAAGQHVTENLAQAIPAGFFGRPTVEFDGTGWDDAAAIVANEELACFADFRQYILIDRVGTSIRRLNELYAGTGQVGFVASRRGDGRVGIANGFRILKAAAA